MDLIHLFKKEVTMQEYKQDQIADPRDGPGE